MTDQRSELERSVEVLARKDELAFTQLARDRHWIDSRMPNGNMSRLTAMLTKEAANEREFNERVDHVGGINKAAENDINMAFEIKQVRQEEAKKLFQRHYLWERDPGLRELVRKLKNGYTSRDLQAQIKYNENKKLQDKANKCKAEVLLLESLKTDVSDEAALLARKHAFRVETQQQLLTREQRRLCQYEDTLVEKKLIEDVMAVIHREDERERDEKRAQREKLQKEMQQTATMRAAWRDIQRRTIADEEVELEHQQSQLSDRNASVIAAREAKVKAKSDMAVRTGLKLQAEEAKKKARGDILLALCEQEAIEKDINDAIADRDKATRVKMATRQALQAQMKHNEILAQEEKARDYELRKETEENTRIENEKELNKQNKLREKHQQYGAALKEQIANNELKRKHDTAMQKAEIQNVLKYQGDWDKRVRQERDYLLEEHAPKVLGYLQAGVLKREDIPLVKAGAEKQLGLGQLNLDSLDKHREPHTRDKCNPQCKVLREY